MLKGIDRAITADLLTVSCPWATATTYSSVTSTTPPPPSPNTRPTADSSTWQGATCPPRGTLRVPGTCAHGKRPGTTRDENPLAAGAQLLDPVGEHPPAG